MVSSPLCSTSLISLILTPHLEPQLQGINISTCYAVIGSEVNVSGQSLLCWRSLRRAVLQHCVGPTHPESNPATGDGTTPCCQVGEKWLWPTKLSHPNAQKSGMAHPCPDTCRCQALILIEAIKYVKLQRNQIHLQQILAKQKYYQMSFFPRTVHGQDWNTLPKDLLTSGDLTSFKAGVSGIEHHLAY